MREETIRHYTVFDVETPNARNDSICSIALVHVEDGVVRSEEHHLVNPEDAFDAFNIGIHHITPAMVRDQPKFPDLWKRISGYFTNGIVIAHNANFDLSVLSKTLQRHHMDIPDFSYLCTMKLSRKAFLDMERYRLDYLCARLGIALGRHHDALCDTQACHSLFQRIQEVHPVTALDVLTYRFSDSSAKKADRPVLSQAFHTLYGLVMGITGDRRISEAEREAVRDWMKAYRRHAGSFPYYAVVPTLERMLADGCLTEKVRLDLAAYARRFIDKDAFSEAVLSMQVLSGMLGGMACDETLTMDELEVLKKWMERHEELSGNHPYEVIGGTLLRVLEDGRISASEHEALLRLLRGYLHPVEESCEGEIDVRGITVCLTGDFRSGSKEALGALIESLGGVVGPGVTKKTGILVVGGAGSGRWSYGSYGTKVRKAMEMRSKGSDIRIIGEKGFLEMLKRDRA